MLEHLRQVLAEDGHERARELLRETVEGLGEPEPGREEAYVIHLLELEKLAEELGSLEEAKLLWGAVLALRERLLPEDHPDILAAKQGLAMTIWALGDLQAAHALCESVLEARTRLLPPDDSDLLAAKMNVAVTRLELGDLAGAGEMFEAVVEAWTRLLPADHPHLLMAKQNLAVTKYELGDLAGARELLEAVLEVRLRLLPPDDPELLKSMQNLAVMKKALGDLAGSRELDEAVLETRTRLFPPDHPELLKLKNNLAGTRLALGDVAGARELYEAVFEGRTHLLPPEHPDLLTAKVNLAAARYLLGDSAGARELLEAVLEVWAPLLSADHPDVLMAKQNLALTRKELGDLVGARELEEEVLEARERMLPSDHPELLKAKGNLAVTMNALGDFAGSRELLQATHEVLARILPRDHPDLLTAIQTLAEAKYRLGDLAGARELVSSLLSGVRIRASALKSEALRSAREGSSIELTRLFRSLSLAAAIDPEHVLEPELFATLENLRATSLAGAEVADALIGRQELEHLVLSVRVQRARLGDRAGAVPEEEGDLEQWNRSFMELATERDRLERELHKQLAEAGAFVVDIDAEAVAEQLASDSAIASYLRYPRQSEEDPESGDERPPRDSLLAFVVRPDASVRRVELASAEELEALIEDWRGALGRPLADRGGGKWDVPADAADIAAIGEKLRQRVLDPVLALAPDARTLHMVLDDLLYLVPLDALPLEGGLVGERFELRSHATLADLVRGQRERVVGGTLLAAGSIDYTAQLGESATVHLDAATPPVELGANRSGAASAVFLPLTETEDEVDRVAGLYEQVFEGDATLFSGGGATKAALFSAAPRARYLHLATHGWFASETCKSQLDTLFEPGPQDASQRAQAALVGFAPETLCGLALAGANRGMDELGRVPGILTAEELATFDLRNCELAVLSACETNVGIRRAGQGIQSLQTALHAAGARAAITSLWKVDDEATRRLFEIFYTKLWKEQLGKAEALWQAKMALRAEGHPPRDWAGWVLTGDPD